MPTKPSANNKDPHNNSANITQAASPPPVMPTNTNPTSDKAATPPPMMKIKKIGAMENEVRPEINVL